MAILEILNLSIGYKNAILQNLNLSAQKGELIAIIGKNGVGKSTLLKTIAKIIEPLRGEILVNDKNILDYSSVRFSKLVGFSSNNSINISNFTVKDLVRLGRVPHTAILGNFKEVDDDAVDFAIAQTGLENLQKKEITKVSDGERQRAFIARLIAQQTDILLLDEPTAFLDVMAKHQTISLFREITKKHNKTVLFSTHDLKIAIQNADKIWIINADKIISGTPEDLILNNKINDVFSDNNIKFDNLTADFYVSKKVIDEIAVISNSSTLRYEWTKKALERIGFAINNDAGKKITVNDDNWLLDNEGISTIENLLKKI